MLNWKSPLVLFLGWTLLGACRSLPIQKSRPYETVIAFGSCNEQDEDQDIWRSVLANSPDLWIWLGDNIYADTEDMPEMKMMYDKQLSHTSYRELLTYCPVIGTWDDHDYGLNNGGKEYPAKDSSKQLLFEFLSVSPENEAWHRPGVYQVYDFGDSPLQVRVILLDVRYFRDLPSSMGGTILGEDQWRWLITQLAESPAEVNIIGGGIQFTPVDHPYEKWANFPAERSRLLHVLDSLDVSTPILISGDRHIAEFMKIGLAGGGFIYEVTSSGLTHSYEELVEEPNRFRIHDFYNGRNFGIIRIAWKERAVHLEVRNAENDRVIYESLPFWKT